VEQQAMRIDARLDRAPLNPIKNQADHLALAAGHAHAPEV
jgi:hypothetical protein